MSPYTIRGFLSLGDFENGGDPEFEKFVKNQGIGDEKRYLIDIDSKKRAHHIAKGMLKKYLIIIVDGMNFNRYVFTNNETLTQYISHGLNSIPKEELPMLMGIDEHLDNIIADKLKE